MKRMKKWMVSIPAILAAMFLFVNIASAHVTVAPNKVIKDSYQVFTVKVPNEMDVPMTSIKVDIPSDADVSSVEPKPNWTYKMEKDKTDKITSITWTATDKGLMPEQFTEFMISAKVAKDAKDLKWKAYQTYKNGKIVKWIGAEGSEHPASVTKITAADSAQMPMDNQKTMKTDSTNDSSSWPLYLSIAALILGLIALIVSLTKKAK